MNKKIKNAKQVRMIRCPNCGAQYEEVLTHCPYCRSVDDYRDESEYLEDLDELRDRLEDLPENMIRDQKRAQTAEAARDFSRILKVLGIAAAVILLLTAAVNFLSRGLTGNGGTQTGDKEKQEYLWKQEYFPKLDELYANKDYEGLLELADSTNNGGIYDWEHYQLIDGLQILEYIPSEISSVENMEKEGKTGSGLYPEMQTSLLRDELMLLYFGYRDVDETDAGIIRERSAEYLKDLETRFALTQEELDAFDRKAREDRGYVFLSDCREFLKNR